MRLSWCEAELYAACIYGVCIDVRRGHAVLRAALPHKEEYVILSWCEAEVYGACIYGVRIYVRRGHAVLRAALPHKEEYVILSWCEAELYGACTVSYTHLTLPTKRIV